MNTSYTVQDLIDYLSTLPRDAELKKELPHGKKQTGLDFEYFPETNTVLQLIL
jgi:hypothetical protein